jgi:hypothetical protein
MSDLVQRLSFKQPIEISVTSSVASKAADAFKAAMDRGYVHVRFPQTKGPAELGVRLDAEKTDSSTADFSRPAGTVNLVGRLTLDYVPVVFHGNIDLTTLAGTGHLEPVR